MFDIFILSLLIIVVLMLGAALFLMLQVRSEMVRLADWMAQIQTSPQSPSDPKIPKLDPLISAKMDVLTHKVDQALALMSKNSQNVEDQPETQDSPYETEIVKDAAEPLQIPMALDTDPVQQSRPLAKEDYISALNFPQNTEDHAGFAALKKALSDSQAKYLVTASQDVLTLLSQDGVYMDDLKPEMARPELWRRFAQGERGRQISDLGGIRDGETLAKVTQRMKTDPIFRDTAHHFLRLFDRGFSKFEPEAEDRDISALADTRTARAFMVLGRVAGTFD